VKAGYTFQMEAGNVHNGSWSTWTAAAWPLTYQSTGVRSFFIDLHAVIRASDLGGSIGQSDMPPID